MPRISSNYFIWRINWGASNLPSKTPLVLVEVPVRDTWPREKQYDGSYAGDGQFNVAAAGVEEVRGTFPYTLPSMTHLFSWWPPFYLFQTPDSERNSTTAPIVVVMVGNVAAGVEEIRVHFLPSFLWWSPFLLGDSEKKSIQYYTIAAPTVKMVDNVAAGVEEVRVHFQLVSHQGDNALLLQQNTSPPPSPPSSPPPSPSPPSPSSTPLPHTSYSSFSVSNF